MFIGAVYLILVGKIISILENNKRFKYLSIIIYTLNTPYSDGLQIA